MLAAVQVQKPSGERLAVFFAVMYYAALRPEEAISLTRSDVTVPDLMWNKDSEKWEEPADDVNIQVGGRRSAVGGRSRCPV